MLTRVTISGADDFVEIADMEALSRRFPFLEWAILIGGHDRFGTCASCGPRT
jgi:hypothetical protein